MLLGTTGAVWQEESFEHTVRNHGSFQDKLEYIRQNPIRRDLVAKPEDYPWLWCRADTPVRALDLGVDFELRLDFAVASIERGA